MLTSSTTSVRDTGMSNMAANKCAYSLNGTGACRSPRFAGALPTSMWPHFCCNVMPGCTLRYQDRLRAS
ncbi:hypothetical protein FOA52_005222 [Chlamydomonas sp. UWO 241]|nr:hypothetical protein FOA52_005222 [Chlamydomonas sp. UWO 241]